MLIIRFRSIFWLDFNDAFDRTRDPVMALVIFLANEHRPCTLWPVDGMHSSFEYTTRTTWIELWTFRLYLPPVSGEPPATSQTGSVLSYHLPHDVGSFHVTPEHQATLKLKESDKVLPFTPVGSIPGLHLHLIRDPSPPNRSNHR
jgi:hypothetical protein